MSRLTRDGTAEPVSRDQILRHARGQGNVHFPCSADHEQDWQPYPVDPYSAICDDHTYIYPRGGVFCCCSWRSGAGRFFFFSRRDGAVFFFPRRDGAGFFFFRGGTGWLFFFFDGTGRGGVFFFRGPGRDGCFRRWHFFWRDGAKSLHRPAKGGLTRPASRPCKALLFLML